MTLYAAIDLHSNNSVLAVVDRDGQRVRSKRVGNDIALVGEHRSAITSRSSPHESF